MKPALTICIFLFSGILSQVISQSALHLDGINDYIEIPPFEEFKDPSDFTLELWFSVDSAPAGQLVSNKILIQCAKELDFSDPFATHIYAGDNLSYRGPSFGYMAEVSTKGPKAILDSEARSVKGGGSASSFDIKPETWHHLAIVFDGTDIPYFYLDGKQKFPSKNKVNLDPETQFFPFFPIYLGGTTKPANYRPNSSGRFFKGKLDELRIWNKALDQEEIQENMLSKYNGDEKGLVALFHMDGLTGDSILVDEVSQHPGKLINMDRKACWIPQQIKLVPPSNSPLKWYWIILLIGIGAILGGILIKQKQSSRK